MVVSTVFSTVSSTIIHTVAQIKYIWSTCVPTFDFILLELRIDHEPKYPDVLRFELDTDQWWSY